MDAVARRRRSSFRRVEVRRTRGHTLGWVPWDSTDTTRLVSLFSVWSFRVPSLVPLPPRAGVCSLHRAAAAAGEASSQRLKELVPLLYGNPTRVRMGRAALDGCLFFHTVHTIALGEGLRDSLLLPAPLGVWNEIVAAFGGGLTTLSGGSLGSCVDEERSQLRELM